MAISSLCHSARRQASVYQVRPVLNQLGRSATTARRSQISPAGGENPGSARAGERMQRPAPFGMKILGPNEAATRPATGPPRALLGGPDRLRNHFCARGSSWPEGAPLYRAGRHRRPGGLGRGHVAGPARGAEVARPGWRGVPSDRACSIFCRSASDRASGGWRLLNVESAESASFSASVTLPSVNGGSELPRSPI